jgi:hypothetical protein
MDSQKQTTWSWQTSTTKTAKTHAFSVRQRRLVGKWTQRKKPEKP